MERARKVYYTRPEGKTPQIRLQGRLLKQAGLAIGDHYRVAVEKGQLILTRQTEDKSMERSRFWKGEGCPSCYGKPVEKRPFRAEAMAALHEVLGDDLDGLAAEMEDAEALMGKEFWE